MLLHVIYTGRAPLSVGFFCVLVCHSVCLFTRIYFGFVYAWMHQNNASLHIEATPCTRNRRMPLHPVTRHRWLSIHFKLWRPQGFYWCQNCSDLLRHLVIFKKSFEDFSGPCAKIDAFRCPVYVVVLSRCYRYSTRCEGKVWKSEIQLAFWGTSDGRGFMQPHRLP